MSNTSFAVGREAASEFNESHGGVQPWQVEAEPGVSPWADASNTTLLPSVHAMPEGSPGAADGLVQTYNYRLCLTNNASNRLPFAPPANYTPEAMEVYRRWFIANKAAVANVTLLSLFLVRDLGESKIDVNQGSLPGASDFPFLQAAYPLADWSTRASIAAAYQWWTRAVWEFLRTDASVTPALRAQAADWGLPADEFLQTEHFPPQLYIRESIRMRGAVVLSQQDVFGSTVGLSNTSVGLSQCSSTSTQKIASQCRPL
jgi:hypothetical protein